jgi:hypothetical protein
MLQIKFPKRIGMGPFGFHVKHRARGSKIALYSATRSQAGH